MGSFVRFPLKGFALVCAILGFSGCEWVRTTRINGISAPVVAGPVTSPVVTGPIGVSNSAFQGCYNSNSTDASALSACLNQQATSGATFPADIISSCQAAGNTSALLLATCLGQSGKYVLGYRPPTQTDIDACNAAVGVSKIAGCLAKRGVDVGVTQAHIDQCNLAVGVSSIEKCLHKNAIIPTNPTVMQSDANFCNALGNGTANLAACLQNGLLVPATLVQADINRCVNNVGLSGVIRCLRLGYDLPRVLMQAHINACIAAVGPANLATCLDKNGLLPMDPSSSATAAQVVAVLQIDINACVGAVGVGSLAKCMRKRGIISDQIMQPHIDSCFAAAGAKAFDCLAANFATLPVGLSTTVLQGCFAANGGTSANAAKCLANQRLLPSVPQQAHINECAKLRGIAPDVTGAKPGQLGVAACLSASALLPAGITQAQVDTCVTAAGLSNVASCMHARSFVPSYARFLNSQTGVFGSICLGCHNAGNMNGMMNIANYVTVLPKIKPGDSLNSKLWMLVDSGAMPKNQAKLPAATIAAIGLWIDQGANDDVNVPATASATLTGGTSFGNLTRGGGLASAGDGNLNQTAAASAQAVAAGGFIGRQFTVPMTVTSWNAWGSSDQCYNNPAVNGAATLQLQYSDDGATYTAVDTVTTAATCTGPSPIARNLPGPNSSHLFWRLIQTSGAGTLTVSELRLNGY